MNNPPITTSYQLLQIAQELIKEEINKQGNSLFNVGNTAVLTQVRDGLESLIKHLGQHSDISGTLPENVTGYNELFATILKHIQNKEPGTFELFLKFWEAWPSKEGRKRDAETEFAYFKRKHSDYVIIATLLLQRIEREKEWRARMKEAGHWIPAMKHMKTWLGNRHWEDELEEITTNETGINATTQNNRPGNWNASAGIDALQRRTGVENLKGMADTILQSIASEESE